MKVKQFLERREASWRELDELLAQSRGRPERLPPDAVRRLGRLYRQVAADLAMARREFPGDPLLVDLENRATRSRATVYGKNSRREAVAGFFVDGYWSLLRHRRHALWLAAALFLGSALFGVAFAGIDPSGAVASVPEPFLWVVDAESTDTGLGAAGLAGFSTAVLLNNILVTILAFALGITFGIGTAWILLQNGYILGTLAGLALRAGNGELLVEAVAAHGILEISCILVGGAAGLSLGRSLLRPGKRTRAQSLAREAPAALKLAAGTAPWLIVAGFIEGYVSRTGLDWWVVLSIGVIVGAVFWGLYFWRSRLSEPTAPARPHIGSHATP